MICKYHFTKCLISVQSLRHPRGQLVKTAIKTAFHTIINANTHNNDTHAPLGVNESLYNTLYQMYLRTHRIYPGKKQGKFQDFLKLHGKLRNTNISFEILHAKFPGKFPRFPQAS